MPSAARPASPTAVPSRRRRSRCGIVPIVASPASVSADFDKLRFATTGARSARSDASASPITGSARLAFTSSSALSAASGCTSTPRAINAFAAASAFARTAGEISTVEPPAIATVPAAANAAFVAALEMPGAPIGCTGVSGNGAPASIHLRIFAISSGFRPSPSGGIASGSARSSSTRCTMRLSAAFPGRTVQSASSPLKSHAFVSMRRPPFCLRAPWHSKQFASKIGRTSLKKNCSSAVSATVWTVLWPDAAASSLSSLSDGSSLEAGNKTFVR